MSCQISFYQGPTKNERFLRCNTEPGVGILLSTLKRLFARVSRHGPVLRSKSEKGEPGMLISDSSWQMA